MSTASPSLRELTAASFKIGCLGFGGPAGQIALMHRIFVAEKKWIDEARYLHALNYCMLLPGPEAQQLATYVGWLLGGVRGGVIAGALFVAPGALVVFALSWLYAVHADTPLVIGLFYGIKAAVLGFVAEALWKVGKRAIKTGVDLAIAMATFVALFVFGAPFPVLIVAAGLIGILRARNDPPVKAEMDAAPAQPSARDALSAALIWAAAWLAPLAAAFLTLGPHHMLTQVGVLFSQLAVMSFGGAYAVLAYLQQQAVDMHGWLSTGQMIDGLGLAETTPGPLILVNQYVGFIAGWRAQGAGLWLATLSAAMASWCTFAPSYLWIFAGAPFAELLRRNRLASAALASITAAVLGVIANLAFWFALHVVFTRATLIQTAWGHALVAPSVTSFDLTAALIALAAGVALVRYKANVALVVLGCASIGLLARITLSMP